MAKFKYLLYCTSGYGWSHVLIVNELNTPVARVRLQENSKLKSTIYIRDFIIFDEFRGQKLATRLLRGLTKLLHKKYKFIKVELCMSIDENLLAYKSIILNILLKLKYRIENLYGYNSPVIVLEYSGGENYKLPSSYESNVDYIDDIDDCILLEDYILY